MAPADVARRFGTAPQPLVGVDVLVGDRADLGRVVQDAGGKLTCGDGHIEFLAGLVERVGVTFEQAQVRVHAGARSVGERLRHEAGMDATLQRDLLDDGAEGHDVVGRGECVRISQIDLVLAWPRLMMRVFHRNAHLFEHIDGGAAEVHARATRHVIEVTALVDWFRCTGPIILLLEQVELDFRMHVERESLFLGFGQRLLEHMAWITQRWLAIGGEHVAEHTCGALRASAPRKNLERRRIGLDDHIVFGHAGEAFHGGTVESEPFLECGFQFRRRDGHGLQCSQHIREP